MLPEDPLTEDPEDKLIISLQVSGLLLHYFLFD